MFVELMMRIERDRLKTERRNQSCKKKWRLLRETILSLSREESLNFKPCSKNMISFNRIIESYKKKGE